MNDSYLNGSQQTLLGVLSALGHQPLQGLSIAALLETEAVQDKTRDQIFRALKNLEAFGWVKQTSDLWQLTPAITQISDRVRVEIANLHHHYLL